MWGLVHGLAFLYLDARLTILRFGLSWRYSESEHVEGRFTMQRDIPATGEPAEGAVNPSLNNLVHAGLHPRYARQNWVWHR